MGRPRTNPRYRYRCDCNECKHEWTSHIDSGTPRQCPRPQCHSRNINTKALAPE